MLTTASQRLEQAFTALGFKTQKEIAKAMDYTQATISNILNSGDELFMTNKLRTALKNLGINEMWVLYGIGDMLLPTAKLVEEPQAVYYTDMYSKQAITERYGKVVNDYRTRYRLTQVKVCERWHLDTGQLSSIINGSRDVSTTVLQNSLRFGNVNLNYVMGAVGGYYINESESTVINEIKQMLDDIKNKVKS